MVVLLTEALEEMPTVVEASVTVVSGGMAVTLAPAADQATFDLAIGRAARVDLIITPHEMLVLSVATQSNPEVSTAALVECLEVAATVVVAISAETLRKSDMETGCARPVPRTILLRERNALGVMARSRPLPRERTSRGKGVSLLNRAETVGTNRECRRPSELSNRFNDLYNCVYEDLVGPDEGQSHVGCVCSWNHGV